MRFNEKCMSIFKQIAIDFGIVVPAQWKPEHKLSYFSLHASFKLRAGLELSLRYLPIASFAARGSCCASRSAPFCFEIRHRFLTGVNVGICCLFRRQPLEPSRAHNVTFVPPDSSIFPPLLFLISLLRLKCNSNGFMYLIAHLDHPRGKFNIKRAIKNSSPRRTL